MGEYAIYIAAASFLVSLTTLYLTQFRQPKLNVYFGKKVRLHYHSRGVGFYVPITFANKTHNTGIVFQCSLAVSRTDAPEQVYYMEWTDFRKLDAASNKYVPDELAHPIPVPGKSSVNKICWFDWHSQPSFVFREGTYKFKFYVWSSLNPKPKITASHQLFIPREIADDLLQLQSENKWNTKELTLDKALDPNRMMTPHETKTLLG